MARLCLIAGLLLGFAAPALAQPADAVVMLVADLKDGQSTVGSGFFVSPDGRLLTAYHLIAGASRIRVVTGKTWTDQVLVQAVAPARDLAVLRVTGMRTRTPFIPLELNLPTSQLAPGPLDVYVPSPTANGSVPVSVTRASQVASAVPRHPTTRRAIYSVGDVDLLQFETSNARGLSGAPVVFNGAAIAVAVGRLAVGGPTAWAIPVRYSAEATPVNRTPQRIDAWPRLTLFPPSRIDRDGRATLGVGLAAALDHLGRFLDASSALQERAMSELTALGNQAIERCHRAADLAIFRYGARHRADDIAPDADEEFEEALGAYATRHRYYETQLLSLDAAGLATELTRELRGYFDRLPPSPLVRARRDRALGHARELTADGAVVRQLTARVAVFERLAQSIDEAVVLEDLQRGAERATASFRALLDATTDTSDATAQLARARQIVVSVFGMD